MRTQDGQPIHDGRDATFLAEAKIMSKGSADRLLRKARPAGMHSACCAFDQQGRLLPCMLSSNQHTGCCARCIDGQVPCVLCLMTTTLQGRSAALPLLHSL